MVAVSDVDTLHRLLKCSLKWMSVRGSEWP